MTMMVALALAGFVMLGGASGTAFASEQRPELAWSGPFTDGCYYGYDYVAQGYAGRVCPDANGTLIYYVPDGAGQWVYSLDFRLTAEGVLLVRSTVQGWAMEFYPDGSVVVIAANRSYGLFVNGVIVETGYVNDQNTRVRLSWIDTNGSVITLTSGESTANNIVPVSIGYPTDGLQNGAVDPALAETQAQVQNAIDSMNCVQAAPIADYDNNNRTTLTEMFEYCDR
jgi:hypothetical protein